MRTGTLTFGYADVRQSETAQAQARRPRLSGRWLLLYFSRVLPVDESGHEVQLPVGRVAHRRSADVLRHAVASACRDETGRAADTPRRRIRQIRAHVPQRTLPRLQGSPA